MSTQSSAFLTVALGIGRAQWRKNEHSGKPVCSIHVRVRRISYVLFNIIEIIPRDLDLLKWIKIKSRARKRENRTEPSGGGGK
jgi:hypothetical protein